MTNKGKSKLDRNTGKGRDIRNRTKNKSQKYKTKEFPKFRITLLAILCFILFYPPFLRGLFFEGEQFFTELIILILFSAFWIYKMLRKDKQFLVTPLDYASFGLVIVYFISIFIAAGLHLAIQEWLKYCMYFAVFLMLSDLACTYKSKLVVLWTMMASGLGVCVIGIDSMAGEHIVNSLNKFFADIGLTSQLKLDVMFFQLSTSGRLSSTIQYPNTLAVYLIALFVVCIGLIVSSDKFWTKMLGGALECIFLFAFILTLSRGAYLILPIVLILYFIILPSGNRIKALASIFAIGICSAFTYYKVWNYVGLTDDSVSVIWKYALIAVVLSSIMTLFVSIIIKWLNSISWKVYVAVFGVIILTGTLTGFYLLNTTEQLELKHGIAEAEGGVAVQKSVVLEPGKQYELAFDVNAEMQVGKPYAYTIDIMSRSKKDILFGTDDMVMHFDEKATDGLVNRKLEFKVPSDSEIINIRFTNVYQGTKAVFDNANVSDKNTGKIIENLKLKYKYIPEVLVTRLEDINATKSGIARETFYLDGLKVFKDHWLLGAGGGAWSLIYTAYQSYDYISSETHNFFLQIAIDTGVIGLLLVLALLMLIVFMLLANLWRERVNQLDKKEAILQASVFAATVAIFAHSAIDFDLSMSAVALLLWSLLGIYNAGYKHLLYQESTESSYKYIEKLFGSAKILLTRIQPLKVSPVLLIIFSMIIAILPASLLISRYYVRAASVAQDNRDQNELLRYMDKVVTYNPFNPKYKVDYANLLAHKIGVTSEDLRKASELIANAEKGSSYNADVLVNLGNYHLYVGNIDKGISAHNRASELRPYDKGLWEFRADTYMQVVLSYFGKNDAQKGLKYVDEALTMINKARAENSRNLNPFKFTDKTMETLERLYFINDKIQQEGSININNIAFYSIAGMDVDRDNMSDQWTIENDTSVSLALSNDIMTVKALIPDKDTFVQSRMLNLNPSKIYRISVELTNSSDIDEIPFSVPGIDDGVKQLQKKDNVYTGEFVTPAEVTPYTAALRIWIEKEYNIKNISIVEL